MIEDYIMSKRKLNNIENAIYEIKPNELIIPDNMRIDLQQFTQNVRILLSYT